MRRSTRPEKVITVQIVRFETRTVLQILWASSLFEPFDDMISEAIAAISEIAHWSSSGNCS
jgi:hypothetical protein